MSRRRRRKEPTTGSEASESSRKQAKATTAADVLAGTAGAASGIGGSLLLPPFGAVVGPSVNVATRKLLRALGVDRAFASSADEYAQQALGPRAQSRVRTAYETAESKIAEGLAAGDTLRNDGFFNYATTDDPHTAAETILANVLLKAQEDYEDKKAQRLGELFAFISKRDDIRPPHANRLIDLAGRLTHQQLLWLGLFAADDSHRDDLSDWESTGAFTLDEQAFVGDTLELSELHLLRRRDNRRIADFTRLNPRQLETILDGKLLVDGMSLREAEENDWRLLRAVLERLGRLDADRRRHAVDTIGLPGSDPKARVQLNYQIAEFPPVGAPIGRDSSPSDIEEPTNPTSETQ